MELLTIPTEIDELMRREWDNDTCSRIEELFQRYCEMGGMIFINGDTITSVYPYNEDKNVDVSKIVSIRFSKKTKEINESCTICLEEFKTNNIMYGLNCNHYFHKRCITKWFKKNINCPNCREDQPLI